MTGAHNGSEAEAVARGVQAAFESRDLGAFGMLLDEHVRWGGEEETPQTCHTRADVLYRLAAQAAAGVETHVTEVVPGDESILVGLRVKRPVRDGFSREHSVYQVLKVRNGLVVDIRGYPSRSAAAGRAGISAGEAAAIEARELVPILNVSSLSDSFEWFGKLGWNRQWDWRGPDGTPTFGAISSGQHAIFLSLNAQGGRGRDGGAGGGGQGVWMSVWVDDVDAVHAVCAREGLEVMRPPQNEPWGVREMQVRHPDGHVLRISQGMHED